jgi:hypothetical protein
MLFYKNRQFSDSQPEELTIENSIDNIQSLLILLFWIHNTAAR